MQQGIKTNKNEPLLLQFLLGRPVLSQIDWTNTFSSTIYGASFSPYNNPHSNP